MAMTQDTKIKAAGHTAGPWSDGIHHRVRDGGREYAYIRGGNDIVPVAAVPLGVEGYAKGFEQGAANARLISAAPEMLEALRNAKGFLDTPISRRRNDGDSFYSETVKSINAALAKAEGRAS